MEQNKLTILLGVLLFFIGTSASADITSDLVLYYTCDEPNVTGVVRDNSPANNNGKAHGIQHVSEGHIGGACRFEGTGPAYEPETTIPAGTIDYIHVKNHVQNTKRSLDVGKDRHLTLATWFKLAIDTEESNEQSPLIEWGGETSPQDVGVHMWSYAQNWGTGANLVDTTGNDSSYVIGAGNPTRGEWHHLVVTYNGTSQDAKVYIDGQPQVAIPFDIIPKTIDDVYIGRRPWDYQRLNGDLDEIRIYKRAFSDEDVQELYEYVGGEE